MTTTTTNPIIVYGRPGCPMVPPVLHALEAAEAPYEYVDIRQDPEGKERVLSINNGSESVPTLLFPDGSTLTEPGISALSKKLAQMGHDDAVLETLGSKVGFTLRNPVYLFVLVAAAVMLIAILLTR